MTLATSSTLTLALVAYTVGVASPGPSNLAIMAAAMTGGRTHALAFAGGVVTGSAFWGLAAALGLSALMQAFSWSLVILKIVGGLYLLWLSWKAARAAVGGPAAVVDTKASNGGRRDAWLRGLALHVTNPKAIFVWLSIVALALPPGAPWADALRVVGCCVAIGACVFFGYAIAFSTVAARAIHARMHRLFNALLAALFGYAGIRLLWSRGQAG